MFLAPLWRSVTHSSSSAARHQLHTCSILDSLIHRSLGVHCGSLSSAGASSSSTGQIQGFASTAGGSRGPWDQSSHTPAETSSSSCTADKESGWEDQQGFRGLSHAHHRPRGPFSPADGPWRQVSYQERGYASRSGPGQGGGGGPRRGGGPPPKFARSPGQPKRKPQPEASGRPVPAGRSVGEGASEAEGRADEAQGAPSGKSPKKLRYPQPQNAPAAPWTFTSMLKKRKTLPKRMGFMLLELEKEKQAEAMRLKEYPPFGSGAVLEVALAVPENKGRPATFKGICISRRNRGYRTSFTLRNHLGSVGGVERTFPLYSPTIQSIKVLDQRRVRRAKLYYLRDRNPKEYRVA